MNNNLNQHNLRMCHIVSMYKKNLQITHQLKAKIIIITSSVKHSCDALIVINLNILTLKSLQIFFSVVVSLNLKY